MTIIRPLLASSIAMVVCFGCSKDLKQENEALRERETAQAVESAKTETELKGAKEMLAEIKGSSEELKLQNANLTTQLASSEERNKNLEASLAEAVDKSKTLKTECENLRSTLSDLEKQAANKKGEVNGVVTYYYNENYGYKPDPGAFIYIAPTSDYPDADLKRLSDYVAIKGDVRSWLEYTQKPIKDDSDRNVIQIVGARLDQYGLKTADEMGRFLETAKSLIKRIELDKRSMNLTSDGNGAFKRSLRPGSYIIVIESIHRYEAGAYCKVISIGPDDEANIDCKFFLY